MWPLHPLLTGVGIIWAHVGGIPTQAEFTSPPSRVGAIADQEFTLTWADNDEDPTGKFTFYYAPSNVPAGSTVEALVGDMLENGVDIPIKDVEDQLAWDTSEVPAGSYFVYAITVDPGLPTVYGISRGTVTVRHAGQPLHPAVVVTAPGPISPPVADRFAVQWEATGEGPLTATVRGKRNGEPGDFVELAVDVPMTPGDVQRGCWVWNLFNEPDNSYYQVQVEVKDAAGRVHAAYPINDITVYRDPQLRDAGPLVSCDAVYAPDAGPVDADPDAGPAGPGLEDDEAGCGCRTGGAPASGGAALLGLVLLGLRRRRR